MATDQKHYRGRNDDGNETTATWKAAEDTAWTQQVDTNFRVRFSVQNDTSLINNLDIQLQYNLNGAGWNNVTAASSVVRSSASPNLADAANLTRQLTAGTGTFQGATGFDEVNGICGGNSMDIAASGYFETEFCVQLRSADVVNGNTVQLRTINSDTSSAWTTYTQTASLTAAESVSATPTVGAITATSDAGLLAFQLFGAVGALALTGVAPTVTEGTGEQDISITPTVGSLSAGGIAGLMDYGLIAAVGDLSAQGIAGLLDYGMISTVGAAVLTGNAPTIDATDHQSVSPNVIQVDFTGYAARMDYGLSVPSAQKEAA